MVMFRQLGRISRGVAGLAGLLLLSALALTGIGQLGYAGAGGFPIDAVGRLFVNDDGVCTAFVIHSAERYVVDQFGRVVAVYENWLVSASHCIGTKLVFILNGTSHPVQGILGFSAGGPRGYDVMVMAFFTNHPVPALEPAFGEYPAIGDRLMLIGYGRGALMMRVGPVLGYDGRGHLVIESFASPGNSGGPVLIPGTRRVVGVGIETTLDVRPGVPLVVCGLGACGVKPPYYAAHIDRLLGMVNLR